MSTTTDFFEGGESIPSVSWKSARVGTKVTGIIDRPHETSQQTTMARPNEPSKPKFYKGPDGADDPTAPMMQAVVTVQTEWRAYEGCSAAFRARAAEDNRPDDGLRRIFILGSYKQPTTNGALRNAMKAADVKKPEVGAVLEFEVIKVTESTTGGADIKDFVARYTKPTAATLAKVGATREEESSSDPWAPAATPTAGAAKQSDLGDEPPF